MHHNFKTLTYLHTVSLNIGSVYMRKQIKSTYKMYVTYKFSYKFVNTGHSAEATKSLKCMVSVL